MNKHCILVYLFTVSILSSTAQEVWIMMDTSEFLSKLRETSLSTNSIKADFTEEKYLSYLKEPQKSSGTFYYKKENKMRWEKKKPMQYVFLVSGNSVKIKENKKEKDISSFNQVIGKIKEMMITLVNGNFNAGKAYRPVYFFNENVYVVKLIPKNKKLASIFDYIQLTFSKESMRLKELAFYEKSGDRSIMKFFNDIVNDELDNKLFINF
ncbi:MAG: outer membrane lipoprotein carrier protein LolA [Bacteroidia bacterium]|nr:outer membrane lipoprotein carrier protein LolA [Bacteroidia bacterium]